MKSLFLPPLSLPVNCSPNPGYLVYLKTGAVTRTATDALRWTGLSTQGFLGNMLIREGSKLGATTLLNMFWQELVKN